MRILISALLLVVCLSSSALADRYMFKSISVESYGINGDPAAWDKTKDDVLAKLMALGDVVEITETPYTVDGTVYMFTYTAKIRIEEGSEK